MASDTFQPISNILTPRYPQDILRPFFGNLRDAGVINTEKTHPTYTLWSFLPRDNQNGEIHVFVQSDGLIELVKPDLGFNAYYGNNGLGRYQEFLEDFTSTLDHFFDENIPEAITKIITETTLVHNLSSQAYDTYANFHLAPSEKHYQWSKSRGRDGRALDSTIIPPLG